jgi:hypothetical protein
VIPYDVKQTLTDLIDMEKSRISEGATPETFATEVASLDAARAYLERPGWLPETGPTPSTPTTGGDRYLHIEFVVVGGRPFFLRDSWRDATLVVAFEVALQPEKFPDYTHWIADVKYLPVRGYCLLAHLRPALPNKREQRATDGD